MPFRFEHLEIPGLVLIEPVVFEDDRGFFLETYRYSQFAAFGIKEVFVQDNQSRSKRAVVRGLHYQKKAKAQGRLIRVVAGEVFDVAVDVRPASPTFAKWVGMHLSAENRRMLYVPVGFAHGFCVLSDFADFIYKSTEEYAPEQEAGIAWNDPDLRITWPLRDALVSARDKALPLLKEADLDF